VTVAPAPTLLLLGRRAATWLFLTMAAVTLLVWIIEAQMQLLAPVDRWAYPLLLTLALVLAAVVRRPKVSLLACQRVVVLAVASYLVGSIVYWLLAAMPDGGYSLMTYTPWLLCGQLLIFTAWPARAAATRAALLAVATVAPVALGTVVPGPWNAFARLAMPVMLNATLAQVGLLLMMFGFSIQVGKLMQLAPGGAQGAVTADELVRRRVAELEQQRAAAEAASHAKDEFLALVSHEMRTPLNIVAGRLEAARAGVESESQRLAVQQAQSATEALLGLWMQVEAYVGLDAARPAGTGSPTPLITSVQPSIDRARVAAEAKGLSLVSAIDPQLSGTRACFDVDGSRLGQLLDILLSNAVKFTALGEVRVELRLRVGAVSATRTGHDGGATRLCVSVQDTGVGMDAQTRGRLFTPFVQAAPVLTRERGGLGLGLAIAARLIESLHGTVQVDSEPGVGTRFVIELPLPPLAPLQVEQPVPAGRDMGEADENGAAGRGLHASKMPGPAGATPPLSAEQRRRLLTLLAENDSRALDLWQQQRSAWLDRQAVAQRAQLDLAMEAIDFERALALLKPVHERMD
jgi:signal transduction histidine kinase